GGANLADSFDPVGADAEPGGAFRGDSLPAGLSGAEKIREQVGPVGDPVMLEVVHAGRERQPMDCAVRSLLHALRAMVAFILGKPQTRAIEEVLDQLRADPPLHRS